jgi:hypothetical protein
MSGWIFHEQSGRGGTNDSPIVRYQEKKYLGRLKHALENVPRTKILGCLLFITILCLFVFMG